MKKLITAVTALIALAGPAAAGEFSVTSADMADGLLKPAQFANAFGCTGGNLSPAIAWSGAPAGTKSFVVTMYDKDAPTGSGFWHWVVVDVPADVTMLPPGAGNAASLLPKGARMTMTDAGQPGFVGACPPPGQTHEYSITVKALKVDSLPLPDNATAAMVGFVSNMNTLATATIVAKGSR